MTRDIEQLAIEAGVIEAGDNFTTWTNNNAIEVLEKFAQAVIKQHIHRHRKNNTEVVAFRAPTKHDLDPDTILETNKGTFKHLMLLGYDHDGDFVFASTMADGGDAVWLLELAKIKLYKMTGDISNG